MTVAIAEPSSVGVDADRLKLIDVAMQAYVDRGVYAGISVLVARRGRIVHVGHCGWRDREAGAPMTADTIFRLYSVRTFTEPNAGMNSATGSTSVSLPSSNRVMRAVHTIGLVMATFMYNQRPRNFTLGVFKFRLTKAPILRRRITRRRVHC